MSLSDLESDEQEDVTISPTRHLKKRGKKKRAQVNDVRELKKQYLKTKSKTQKIEQEIKTRIDKDILLLDRDWIPSDIFLYKTPLFKGTSEYDYALQIAAKHGITPFNCQLILRTIGSEGVNNYYYYRNGMSPLHLAASYCSSAGEEFVENNILKTW